ncbi:MAG: sodium:proton antiporter [Planctomycetota bacterium]
MTLVLAICVAVILTVSIYLMLGRELKEIAMGVFLLSHAAHLSIIAMSRSPIRGMGEIKAAPILTEPGPPVDALPQALILTSIVISFAVSGFLLTLIVLTGRKTGTLNVDDLSREQMPTP